MMTARFRLTHLGLVLATLFSPIFLMGCPLPPQTVSFVDLERYTGLWYQIAAYPQFFSRGLVAITAQYSLNEDGTVAVFNRGLEGDFDGEESTIEGTARIVDEDSNAKLAVRFDFPLGGLFEGEYWIIALDEEDYTYAVVSDSTKRSLFILSRTPSMDQQVLDEILADLEARGYDLDKLEYTPQQTP
ncbi:MAG: lipocalin family protein [Candidatus Hydrogenedentes bacterium]|nr:lipocalin family protein [Candidatus Hydrogenedentota bacterium]